MSLLATSRATWSAVAGAALLAALLVALVLNTRGEDRPSKVVPNVVGVDCSSRVGVAPRAQSFRLCFGPTHRLQTDTQVAPGTPVHWRAATAWARRGGVRPATRGGRGAALRPRRSRRDGAAQRGSPARRLVRRAASPGSA